MNSDDLTSLERRMVRTAQQMSSGFGPFYLGFQIFLLVVGAAAAATAWRASSGSLASAATGGALVGSALVGIADYPLLRALGKVTRPSGVAPPLVWTPVRWGGTRTMFALLVPAGLATIGVALWRLDTIDAPSWTGVAMGAVGGITIATGLLGASLPGWARAVAARDDAKR